MSPPEISILLPVRNGMPYLPVTIASILRQTFANFELLVMDDGSTDGTADYISSVDDPRIRYTRLKGAGLVAALNHGLGIAKSDLIARIDADDIAEPQRLHLQADYMRSHASCVLLGCNFVEVDENDNIIATNDYPMTTDKALRWQLLLTTPFLHPGVMFRKSAAIDAGGYRSEYDVAEDYDLWVRLAAVGGIAALPEVLMRKRIHSQAVSVVHREKGLTQSSKIAAGYARQVSGQLDPLAIEELYWLYIGRRAPQHAELHALVKTFNKSCVLFEADRELDAELMAAIDAARQKLRRTCSFHALRSLRRPRQAWSWIRAMRGFDPVRGALSSAILRAVRVGGRSIRRPSGVASV